MVSFDNSPVLWETLSQCTSKKHKFCFIEIYLHYVNEDDKKKLLEEYEINSFSNSCPSN